MNTKPYQWTNAEGDVLILKSVPKDGITRNGFKWPLEVGAEVEAPDWD